MDEFMRLWHETNKLMEQRPYPSAEIRENQRRMRDILGATVPSPSELMVPLKAEG